MNEDFLSYLWQHQYFAAKTLQTVNGESISVFRPGHRNTDAGPDFLEAQMEIDGLLWAGAVEMHIHTSDWNLHGHQQDKAYESVILHVVWENNLDSETYPNSRIPVLELKSLVDPQIQQRYLMLGNTVSDIPCENLFADVAAIEKTIMVSRALVERLRAKAQVVEELLAENLGDWNETAWQLLARYFGARINADAFQKLAQNVPLKLLLRHRSNLLQVEAILFGMAGLIPNRPVSDVYVTDLKREFEFLTKKYSLNGTGSDAIEWKMLRLRPAGFPTVRIAQLAALVCRNGNIFSLMLNTANCSKLAEGLRNVQSPYWHTHYHFSKTARSPVPVMGEEAIRIVIVNVAAPLLAAYGYQNDNREYLERAVAILEALPAENNRITRKWAKLGMKAHSAAASQGTYQWYKEYCLNNRCLLCNVGNAILTKSATNY